MKALFYDTETQGLPLWNQPSEHPSQPHIVQVGALLVDIEKGKTLASLDLTVCPDGWVIPDDVAKIHGITTEHASSCGVPESLALRTLIELWQRADFRVGHNEQFDARIIRIALHRFAGPDDPERWKNGRAECTQVDSTPILKLPPTERMIAAGFGKKFKSANLREAHMHFIGEELVDAHSAFADAKACRDVWFAIKHELKRTLPKATPAAAAATHE